MGQAVQGARLEQCRIPGAALEGHHGSPRAGGQEASCPLYPRDGVCLPDSTTELSSSPSSQVNCKAAIAFFQYSVLANFYWLLVEGMYLQTLLLLTFTSDKSYIWWYILIGWGECAPPPPRHIFQQGPSSAEPGSH